MKVTVKTFKVRAIHQILALAKYGKMDASDQIKVWKIVRKLAPISEKFSEDLQDALKKFKPTDKDFEEKNEKYQRYLQMSQTPNATPDDFPMGPAEADEFKRNVLDPYDKIVTKAVKEFGDKEVKVEFEPIKESAFEKLMASNDWNFAQATEIGDFICK